MQLAAGSEGKPRKKSEKRRREAQIKIRVSEKELEAIESNARGCGLTTADFIRRIGQGYLPQSRLDQSHVRDLCTVAGDLGRLGGLLKLWIVEKRSGSMPLKDQIPIPDVDTLWRDIQSTYAAVKQRVGEL